MIMASAFFSVFAVLTLTAALTKAILTIWKPKPEPTKRTVDKLVNEIDQYLQEPKP